MDSIAFTVPKGKDTGVHIIINGRDFIEILHDIELPFATREAHRGLFIGALVSVVGIIRLANDRSSAAAGFNPVTYSRSHFPNDFEHYLYTYVESGIPVIAATKRHAIVAFGHKSEWIPPATLPTDISFSSQFNHAFVVNDDNRIPYQLLREKKQGNNDESQFEFKDIESFVAPLADKIFLSAESFQQVVTTILGRGDVGYKALSATLSAAPLILRVLLTSARSFKKRLAERGMGHSLVAQLYLNLPLPHFFWVCEISHMGEYLKHMIHGEILWDATRNASEPDGWIALHYPEVLVVDVGSALNQRQSLQKYPLQNSQLYPLYQSNLQDIQP